MGTTMVSMPSRSCERTFSSTATPSAFQYAENSNRSLLERVHAGTRANRCAPHIKACHFSRGKAPPNEDAYVADQNAA